MREAADHMGSRKAEAQSSPPKQRKGLDSQVMTRGMKVVVDGNSVSHCRVVSA